MALLEVNGLSKAFNAKRRRDASSVPAVDNVSFSVARGETLALVGESGAGKSTTGRLILRLIEPDAGTILIDGADVSSMDRRSLRDFRRRAQMIFQDPHSSFDPRLPVGTSLLEPLRVHRIGNRHEQRERVISLLDQVGLGPHVLSRYPSELSGGQLQRAAIARALTTGPDLIVCDEAVSALDVSIQAQVINVLQDIQREQDVAYLFITHDLALVEAFADEVVVMRSGRVEEAASVGELFRNPRSEYTQQLLDAIPYIESVIATPSPALGVAD